MTREEIIEAIQNDDMMPFLQDWEARDVVGFVLKNYRPSLPSDLDEAAERIVVSLVPTFGQKYEDGSYVQGTRDYFSRDELIGLVKAGAEWQANQGAGYETVISADKTIPVLPMKDVSEMGFDYGDKVVVQIRKK